MTARQPLVLVAWILLVAGLGALFVPGCSENGQTGNCPALTLYDINAAGERNSPTVQAERARSVAADCMTPLLDASAGDQ